MVKGSGAEDLVSQFKRRAADALRLKTRPVPTVEIPFADVLADSFTCIPPDSPTAIQVVDAHVHIRAPARPAREVFAAEAACPVQ